MRLIVIYLGVYFALVVGAVVALWAGGVLAHLSPLVIVFCLVFAVALGVLLAALWRWRPA